MGTIRTGCSLELVPVLKRTDGSADVTSVSNRVVEDSALDLVTEEPNIKHIPKLNWLRIHEMTTNIYF